MKAAELRQALTSDELVELRKRNEERAKAMREKMGRVYVLHPSNRVKPQPAHGVLR